MTAVAEQIDSNNIEGTDGNTVMQCVLSNDIEKLNKIFDDNPESHTDFLNYRDKWGKSVMEMACMLGRIDILKELAKKAPDIIESSKESGYSFMHLSACWGKQACLEALFELGVSIDARTLYGESPKQLALRYDHNSCVDFIDWAAAKLGLTNFITYMRELVSDPEKLQAQGIKLTKDEKNSALNACNEKQEWLDNAVEATRNEILETKLEIEKILDSILYKNTSPVSPSIVDEKK